MILLKSLMVSVRLLGGSNVSETFVKDERIPLVGNLVGLQLD
jgi:hypothetical protein|tara:strand:+ start:31 stop:156 length:126 start_codon:yes stop_codon:yes gene_type:complete